jgi:hypothetical protein
MEKELRKVNLKDAERKKQKKKKVGGGTEKTIEFKAKNEVLELRNITNILTRNHFRRKIIKCRTHGSHCGHCLH